MNENEILAEIRRTRDEHARECGYDVHTSFEQMRAEPAQLKPTGGRSSRLASANQRPSFAKNRRSRDNNADQDL